MKTLLQLAEEWRTDFRENPGGSADCASSGCADELEAWVRELADELDKAEADQRANRVGTLGPLYDVGINVGRKEIRRLLGVSNDND